MGTATEYNRAERVFRTLRDIYGKARHFHWMHWQILEELESRVYNSPDWRKLTQYYRGKFAGIRETLADDLWRNHLEWRLYLDGKLVKSSDIPKGRWSDAREGNHVWKDAPDHLFNPIAPLNPPHLAHKKDGRR